METTHTDYIVAVMRDELWTGLLIAAALGGVAWLVLRIGRSERPR